MTSLFAPTPRVVSLHDNSIYRGRLLKNLMGLLQDNCRHSFYEVLPRGIQVWLPNQQAGVYPDLMVIAGEPFFHEGHSNKVTNPCLLFEIVGEPPANYMDPSCPLMVTTKPKDGLFGQCRAIPYLQEYVFVYQQTARVERFYRATEHGWGLSVYDGLETVAELDITGTRLPLVEIYNKVEFELVA